MENIFMTNFEKYKKELISISKDSKLCEAIYDIKCLMEDKCDDNKFMLKFLKWLEADSE